MNEKSILRLGVFFTLTSSLSPYFVYWMLGGNFERGEDLGIAAFFSVAAILFVLFVISILYEEAKSKKK